MNIDFNPETLANTNAQTNSVGSNGYVPANKWLRVDIKLGENNWLQVGFMNLNGSKPDKGAINLVNSLKLNEENPEFVSEKRGIRFTHKSADAEPKELDISSLL